MREGVLISINEEIFNDDWMQKLLNGIPQTYDTKRIVDAYENMPIYFYLTNEGIKYIGRILNPNDGYPELVIENELIRPMDIDMMRKTGIIKKNPPQQTQYLDSNQIRKIEKFE